MPFAAPAALPPVVISRDIRDENHWGRGIEWADGLLYLDPTRFEFARFKIGDIRYRSLQPLKANYNPPAFDRSGRVTVQGLSPEIIGRGSSLKEAKRDWQLNLDAEVQRLFGTQEFELTTEDKTLLRKLNQFFDLNELRYSTPIAVRSYGRLLGVRGHKYRVRWVDGTKSTLSRKQIPASMVPFQAGQPFEAVVSRDPRTWNILRIESAFRANGLPAVSEEEAVELFSATKDTSVRTLGWD